MGRPRVRRGCEPAKEPSDGHRPTLTSRFVSNPVATSEAIPWAPTSVRTLRDVCTSCRGSRSNRSAHSSRSKPPARELPLVLAGSQARVIHEAESLEALEGPERAVRPGMRTPWTSINGTQAVVSAKAKARQRRRPGGLLGGATTGFVERTACAAAPRASDFPARPLDPLDLHRAELEARDLPRGIELVEGQQVRGGFPEVNGRNTPRGSRAR